MELEDITEEHSELTKSFEELFSDMISKQTEETTKKVLKPKELVESKDAPKSAKNLYKKLVKKLHPDKGGNEEDFKELHNRYTKSDLLGIIEMAIDNDITVNISEDDEVLLSKSIHSVDTKIKHIKNTLPYVWKYGSPTDRQKVLMGMADHIGIEVDIDGLSNKIKKMLGL